MREYNPAEYETVKQRKSRFYKEYPDGRILVKIHNTDLDEKAVVTATIYLNKEEQEKNLARATGNSLEVRDKELKRSRAGKEYESVNFSSWLENAEESAVGRALDNAGYASNGKCSLDELEKAARNSRALSQVPPAIFPDQPGPGDGEFPTKYVVPFGKWKGRTPEDIYNVFGPYEISDYLSFLDRKAKEENKPLAPNIQEFVDIMTDLLGSKENQPLYGVDKEPA